ncbi:TPA: hypothetical protein N0F65_005035 [Lagenidium giganteum]|uniref:Uncharacterized protein n=1 Tax=Lagenidium giganteum TaxID=4803 RepID=A0AAV2ZI00_9STRA|nr:TPA: hypothetical protein N0F65_005035 [Lagenidium giganteum]
MYMMAVMQATGADPAYVLENLVKYACPRLKPVLMARYNPSRQDHISHAEELVRFATDYDDDLRPVPPTTTKAATKHTKNLCDAWGRPTLAIIAASKATTPSRAKTRMVTRRRRPVSSSPLLREAHSCPTNGCLTVARAGILLLTPRCYLTKLRVTTNQTASLLMALSSMLRYVAVSYWHSQGVMGPPSS